MNLSGWLWHSAGGAVSNRVCLTWKMFLGIVTRCLLSQSVSCLPSLPRAWKEPWVPSASWAPAVIQYVSSVSSRLPELLHLSASRQWWRDPLVSSPFSLSPSPLRQGPQGDKGSRGETVRSLLTNPLSLSVLWAPIGRRRRRCYSPLPVAAPLSLASFICWFNRQTDKRRPFEFFSPRWMNIYDLCI